MKKSRIILLLAVLSQFLPEPALARSSPKSICTTAPSVSEELATTPGEVELLITLNRFGYVSTVEVQKSTNFRLDRPCLEAVRRWRFTAPEAEGSAFLQTIRFGGDTIDTTPIAATRPVPQTRVAPYLPYELADLSGEVTVALAIDAKGSVTDASIVESSHVELNRSCLEAARQWTFKPATGQGHPIASNAYVPFHFTGSSRSINAETAEAALVDYDKLVPVRQPNPEVPESLANLTADVAIAITVDPRGYVVAAAIESTTNASLAEIARSAVLRWKFHPVVRGGVPITVKAIQPMRFGQGSVSTATVDQLPSVLRAVSPDLPDELRGASGSAVAMFDVDANGRVENVTITQSTHEVFKAAVLVAAKNWIFHPAIQGGVATSARVSVPFVFGQTYASY